MFIETKIELEINDENVLTRIEPSIQVSFFVDLKQIV